jgi:3-phenylpropionate/cinnamic acid dioxygenase small subunit
MTSTRQSMTDADGAPGERADAATHFEVEQFYYQEAELLDDGRFTDWLDLLADDLHYWMPTRSNRIRRQQAFSIAAPGEAAFYDETKESLSWRIRRFDSGMAWAEDPPSRTRHLVSNVVVRHAETDSAQAGNDSAHGGVAGNLLVRSAFLLYRNRLERETNIYAGGRTDLLRRGQDGQLLVARRTILLDQNVLLAKNISTFF